MAAAQPCGQHVAHLGQIPGQHRRARVRLLPQLREVDEDAQLAAMSVVPRRFGAALVGSILRAIGCTP